MKNNNSVKKERNLTNLAIFPMAILILLTNILFISPAKTFALAGLINDTIQIMEETEGSSQGSSSCSSGSCSSGCTINCSSSGSLADRISTTISDMQTSTNSSNTSGSSYNPTYSSVPSSCPFSSSSDRYVVNLGTGIRADLTQSRSRFTVNSNIPAGNYNIRVFTWDGHSDNGGQNQTHEQAVLRLYDSSGSTLYTTSRTQDIPNSSNSIISTVATNVSIDQRISEILVFHPEYQSTNPESLVPVCAEFRRIADPVIDNDDLEVQCEVSRTRINEGDIVEFEAVVTGGDSPYEYEWDGDISSSRSDFEVEFNNEGNYYIDVTVTDDDGNTAFDSCPVIVVDEEDDWDDDDLDIQCVISDSTIYEDDYVTIEVEIDGGDSPFDIEWDRDADEIDDFDLNDRYQRIRVRDEGTYNLRVTVEDDNGNRDTDTCTLRVRNEDEDDDRDVNVYSSSLNRPDGDLAGLSSVYLNQVPYTGPEDAIKVFGFIALMLIWSATIAYYVFRARTKKKTSNRIEAFKQSNRESLVA